MGLGNWVKRKLFGGGGYLKALEAFKTVPQDNEIGTMWGSQFNFVEYCDKYSGYYNNYPKVKSSVTAVAGQTLADGIFVVPAQRLNTKTGEREKYERSIEAAAACEKLNKRIDMERLIRDTARGMAKFGTVFWEKTFSPEFNARLVPNQKYMKPIWSESKSHLLGWKLEHRKKIYAAWQADEIVAFAWDRDENTPYGTSLLVGLDREILMENAIRSNLLKYMEKEAWTWDLIQLGDDLSAPTTNQMSTINSRIRQRASHEPLVTNYKIDHKTVGPGGKESQYIEPTLRYTDDQVTDALMMPPISTQRQTTEASIRVMMEVANQNLIKPYQSVIGTLIEKEIYFPYLLDLGYSVRVVPDIVFNPADSGQKEKAEYHAMLIQNQVETPEQAADQLGIPYDEKYWEDLLRREQAEKNKAESKARVNRGDEQKGTPDPRGKETMEKIDDAIDGLLESLR